VNERFNRFSHRASKLLGSSYAFIAALVIVIGWLASGPMFHFSDSWQLIINTGTTIVTFLMVFVIQNSQNRDAIGLHLKLDELIRATKGASNTMIDLGKLSDHQLAELERHYLRICDEANSDSMKVGEDAHGHQEDAELEAQGETEAVGTATTKPGRATANLRGPGRRTARRS